MLSTPTRRQFLASASLALAGRAASPQPANFVFILVDDMGWRDLGCHGSSFYETPNIDRLAGDSVRFTDAYAACPVCSPTRASILTGKYPARLGITDWIPGRAPWPTAKLLTPRPPEFKRELPLVEVTIPQMLRPAGYASASIGKWHLGGPAYHPDKHGFDLNVGGTERGQPASYFGPFNLPKLQGGSRDEYLTDRLTVEAEKFIEANRNRPFFLYLPEFAVHLPKQAKSVLIDRFRMKADPTNPQHDPTYAAMIASLDENVRRLMSKLDAFNLTPRTVVILMSDNGGVAYQGRQAEPITSNAPLRAGKGHLYEGGIREPMLIRWPGVTHAGTVCDVPVSSIDFFPTILDMAGIRVPRPANVDGMNLAPLLRRSGTLRREAVYWHYPHYSDQGGYPSGAVRAGDYKLIEFYEDGRLELYNLAKDIREADDLSRREPKRTARMRQMLETWREAVGAVMPAPNPKYDPAAADEHLTGEKPAPAKQGDR
jgi:arylsulfatase A-like enzyme